MIVRVSVSDLRIINSKLIGDLEYYPYGIYILDYEFDEGDIVEQDEIEAWIDMDEDKLLEIGNVY